MCLTFQVWKYSWLIRPSSVHDTASSQKAAACSRSRKALAQKRWSLSRSACSAEQDAARDVHQRAKQLAGRGAIAEEQYREAERKRRVCEAQLEQARPWAQDYLETYADRMALPVRTGIRVTALARSGVGIADFSLGQPSLDEVFLALTGHPTEDVA